MALHIAKNSGLTDVISEGTGANPHQTQHPIEGSAVETRLWLFNDDATKRYESVSIVPTDTASTDESGWIQLAPDNGGAPGVYGAAGASLAMANVSDSAVGHAFWVRVTTPAVGSVQNKSDLKLGVDFTEFAV